MENKTQAISEHKVYLYKLQDSGITNMYGASPYLQEEFGLSKQEARAIVSAWMKEWNQEEHDAAVKPQLKEPKHEELTAEEKKEELLGMTLTFQIDGKDWVKLSRADRKEAVRLFELKAKGLNKLADKLKLGSGYDLPVLRVVEK